MIKSFYSKPLATLWKTGVAAKIRPDLQKRARVRLQALDDAITLTMIDQPGFDFYALKGKPQRYTIHINGPRCITFEWDGADAHRVDLEQYH
jgi:proteic killer suppression protein